MGSIGNISLGMSILVTSMTGDSLAGLGAVASTLGASTLGTST